MLFLLLAIVGGVFATFCSTKSHAGFFCDADTLVWCVWDYDLDGYISVSETECTHGCQVEERSDDQCVPEPCVRLEGIVGLCDFVNWYTTESFELIKDDLAANASVWYSDLDAEFTALYLADGGEHMTSGERDVCVNEMEKFACAKFLPECAVSENSRYGWATENCRAPCLDSWACFEQFGDPNANPLRNMTIFSTRTIACAALCAGKALIQVSLFLLAMLMVVFL